MPEKNEDLEIDLSEFGWEGGPTDGWDQNDLDFDLSDFATEDSDNGDNQEGDDEGKDPEDKKDEDQDPDNQDDKDKDTKEGEEGDEDPAGSEDTDNTLDEIENLLKDLDDDKTENLDEAQKVLDAIKDLEWAEGATALIEQLQTDSKQDKATIESMKTLVDKLTKEKWDLSAKNAELELYGWSDDTQLVYLNANLTKARAGDDSSKKKIVWILDDLRVELSGKTKEEEEQESADDKIGRFTAHNGSKVDPNLQGGEGLNDMTIELD